MDTPSVPEMQTAVASLIKAMITIRPKSEVFLKAGIREEEVTEDIPRRWWVNCISRTRTFAENPEAHCLRVWTRPREFPGGEEAREALGTDKVILKGIIQEAPPRIWWDSAMAIAKEQVLGLRNLAAYCGLAWYEGSDSQRRDLGQLALERKEPK